MWRIGSSRPGRLDDDHVGTELGELRSEGPEAIDRPSATTRTPVSSPTIRSPSLHGGTRVGSSSSPRSREHGVGVFAERRAGERRSDGRPVDRVQDRHVDERPGGRMDRLREQTTCRRICGSRAHRRRGCDARACRRTPRTRPVPAIPRVPGAVDHQRRQLVGHSAGGRIGGGQIRTADRCAEMRAIGPAPATLRAARPRRRRWQRSVSGVARPAVVVANGAQGCVIVEQVRVEREGVAE